MTSTPRTAPATAAPNLGQFDGSTPTGRNRPIDLYRVVAMVFVAIGYWLVIAIGTDDDGDLFARNAASAPPLGNDRGAARSVRGRRVVARGRRSALDRAPQLGDRLAAVPDDRVPVGRWRPACRSAPGGHRDRTLGRRIGSRHLGTVAHHDDPCVGNGTVADTSTVARSRSVRISTDCNRDRLGPGHDAAARAAAPTVGRGRRRQRHVDVGLPLALHSDGGVVGTVVQHGKTAERDDRFRVVVGTEASIDRSGRLTARADGCDGLENRMSGADGSEDRVASHVGLGPGHRRAVVDIARGRVVWPRDSRCGRCHRRDGAVVLLRPRVRPVGEENGLGSRRFTRR